MDGDPVGLGFDEAQVFGGSPGLRRTWIAVRSDHRRRGIGSLLWDRIEAHAREVGGLALRSWAVEDQTDGGRFLRAREFVPVHRELQSWIDPTTLDPRQLERRRAEAEAQGFRVATLRELLPTMESPLRRLFLTADEDTPGHVGETSVAASTFRRVVLHNPTLDLDLSTVVLNGSQPLALCWLKGDLLLGRYVAEFTATAKAWRGRGLATLAKLTALDLAARANVRYGRGGLGSQLMDAAEGWANNREIGEIQLHTWEFLEGPLGFYERRGYMTIERTLVLRLEES